MLTRRSFIKALAALPFAGKFISEMGEVSAAEHPLTPVFKEKMKAGEDNPRFLVGSKFEICNFEVEWHKCQRK